MKILHAYFRFNLGGSENLTISIINYDETYHHKVLVFQGKSDYQEEISKLYGIHFINLNIQTNNFFSPNKWKTLFKTLKKEKPDLIHSYMFNASLSIRIAAFFMRIPIVIYVVNTYKKKIFKRSLINHLLGLVTYKIIACSEDVRDNILKNDKVSPNKVEVISSFARLNFIVDRSKKIRTKHNVKQSDFLGLFISRLVEQKGLHILVDAIDICVNIFKLKNIKIIILGNGPLLNSLQIQIKKLSLEEHIFLPGESSDINPYLSESDFYVDSSLWAGLSVASIKAMEAMLSIVITDVGGAKELTANGKYGILVKPNDPISLANGIETALNLKSEKKNRVAQYRHVKKFFSDKVAVEKILKIYNCVV